MRRILNLNQPGIIFVRVIGLFVIAIPTVLYVFLHLLRGAEVIRAFLRSAIKISFGIGVLTSILFLILIVAEQLQDYYLDVLYRKNQYRKMPLANGNYECQYCGNQRVRESDKICQVCGRELE